MVVCIKFIGNIKMVSSSLLRTFEANLFVGMVLDSVLKRVKIWVDKLRKRVQSRGTKLWQHEYYWGMRVERKMRVGLWRILHIMWRTFLLGSLFSAIWYPILGSWSYPPNLLSLDFFLPCIHYLLTSLGLTWVSWSLSLICLQLSTMCPFSAWSSWIWVRHLGIPREVRELHAWQLGEFFPFGKS